MNLLLPPRALVSKPDAEDPIDYYYKPLTRGLYRARLRDALQLLGEGPYDALLDIGYGSGVFLPELARRTNRLVGVDVHAGRQGVAEMAAGLGIAVELLDASLFELPFDDGTFDALVCISVMEHLRELEPALAELRRVLRRGGLLVLGTPVRNLATSSFFRLVGYDPAEIHPSSHSDLETAIERVAGLSLERRVHFPRVLPVPVSAYVTFGCRAV
ncbi:MAG TPA: class I SAM-dependent methyltransferase [Gaiellaceae bacterium]|jgi:2-polyprenyl-3-methyl-5-hydroxy-6-metoxy-1,4-benzoquinol methylase